MDVANSADSEQAKLWNGAAGRAWVESQALLDRFLQPFEDLLVHEVGSSSTQRVLDVGCGTGSTTLAIARRLGPQGAVVGLDISTPMIASGRSRAERERIPATFICADAQTYAFDPATFDLIVSRFGVMFFSDPAGAFANLRRAAREGARLRFVAWRSAAENPFMTAAERAAAAFLPDLPPRRPDAPGQFAFANRERVRKILEESGWDEIAIQPIDVICVLPEKELVPYVARLGPVGLALQQADEPTRAKIVEKIRPAFDGYVRGDEVRVTAASWMVSARSTGAAGRAD
jgi:SAM-dependent methyltransferase